MQSVLSKGVGVLLRTASKHPHFFAPAATTTKSFILLETGFASSSSSSPRFFSTKTAAATAKDEPEKSVFISQSADIHTNLALEDWLYKNFNFENHQVLLLWRNDPCVVIGRHQNPWAEVDVNLAEESKLTIARRNSGGGCVYHDRGNLNCTFFTPRAAYDRKKNLEIICRALDRGFDLQAEVSPREDVTLHGYKQISGTAAKLGKNAYHHCTVLVDADLNKLSSLLNPKTDGLESKATKSVKSPVKNLKAANDDVTVENALASIGYEYLRTDSNGNDGGEEQIQKQRGFQMVNPTNEWFPGLDKIRSEFRSWDWNYGKTPEFSFHRSYPVGLGRDGNIAANISFRLKVVKGLIQLATLELPSEKQSLLDPNTFADLSAFINAIKERPFHMGIFATFEGLLFKRNNPVSLNATHQRIRESLLNA
ncbi:Lipoyltransferase 1, mitochondrial [Orchesella cincta]|uniref:Lipoyltransferase 1, mitochondrial n=1 Tax=Orchesella cincta TaxID=48709 RepID=A0A1D2N3Y8_ORCCI|nr:Lipoyltransferase 1, mitochondrial [Orchesella cincta]